MSVMSIMRRARAIGCGILCLVGSAGACGGDDCNDDPRWFNVKMPPSPDAGTEEEWSALPCAEACARARDLNLTPYRVVTRCDRATLPVAGPVVRCFYAQKECSESH